MLTLPIKKKWFDMIVSGEKKEEYREIKPYYDSRFMDAFCKNLYKAGHADGMKDAEGLTEDEVREVILGVKGIGPKKAEDIVNALTAAQRERS